MVRKISVFLLISIRQFIGLAGFYRQLIKNFILIAQLLTHLLKKNVAFIWSEKEENAFDLIKTALCQAVLGFHNFEKDFILYTYAPSFGIGAVLMQNYSLGKHRLLTYASRLLNKAEQNCNVTKRESFAVIWALRHFRH